jgi:integrase
MKVALRRKKLKSGAESLYLDIYHNGQRSYEFLDIRIDPKTQTPEDRKEREQLAQLIKANRESDILTNGTGYVPERKKKVSFNTFIGAFIADYKKKDLRMIKGALSQFKAFSNEKTYQMSQITPALCKQFAEYLKDDAGLSGETPKNYFTRFKKVLSAATSEGYLKENPASKVKVKFDDSDNLKKQILQADEMKLLLQTECGNDEVKRAFLFACNTGLGAAEIRKLTWAKIANNRLQVNREKVKSSNIHIPLSKTAIALIGDRGKSNEKVFTLEQSDNAINKVLRNWTARAGIDKHITFYCGRHTFAVQLLSNGANLKTVADCMGHTSTKHTIKYLNYVDSLRDAAIDSLPDIFNDSLN